MYIMTAIKFSLGKISIFMISWMVTIKVYMKFFFTILLINTNNLGPRSCEILIV